MGNRAALALCLFGAAALPARPAAAGDGEAAKDNAALIRQKLDAAGDAARGEAASGGAAGEGAAGGSAAEEGAVKAAAKAGATGDSAVAAPKSGTAPSAPAAGSGNAGRIPAAAPQGTSNQPPARAQAQTRKQEAAVKKARRAGDALKKAMTTGGDELGAAPGGTAAPATAAAPRETSVAAPDAAAAPSGPSLPKSPEDLMAASVSGFSGTFKDLGLSARRGPGGEALIQDAAGRPASKEQIAALSARIAAEPAALMRRPDFFGVLPRAEFQELKSDYAERPALRGTVFKDIGMSPGERDFLYAASCQRLSGGCNPYVAPLSYRKNDPVEPEDLAGLWRQAAAAKTDADGGSESEDVEIGGFTPQEEERLKQEDQALRMFAKVRGAVGRLLDAAGDFFAGGPSADASGRGGGAAAAGAPDAAVAGAPGARAKLSARAVSPRHAGPPPASGPETESPRPRGRLWGLTLTAAILLAAAVGRRKA